MFYSACGTKCLEDSYYFHSCGKNLENERNSLFYREGVSDKYRCFNNLLFQLWLFMCYSSQFSDKGRNNMHAICILKRRMKDLGHVKERKRCRHEYVKTDYSRRNE